MIPWKCQNSNSFLKCMTDGRIEEQTEKPKAICSCTQLFQSWGHKMKKENLLYDMVKEGFHSDIKKSTHILPSASTLG